MSLLQDVSAEQLAKVFHHYREALAHDYDCKGSEQASSCWDRTPVNERRLLVAAAQLALQELKATASEDDPNRKYFAKPGEAEWGC